MQINALSVRWLLCSAFLLIVAMWVNVTTLPSLTTTKAEAQAFHIPAPEEVLGFRPGDDRKLASWAEVIEYFQKLAATSDRLKFAELGKTTMGAPFVMATISAPENLAHLDDYRKIQEQLADPRKLGAASERDRKAADLIARGKTIVLITCGIHSDEVGGYLSSMLIAHRLASSNEPEIREILKNTIILLVPSLNPDGVDIVKNWYDKTLGTPYEGTDPPELYHKYAGHDDNRDWYAFTQVETQITVGKIHNVWHPQIVHDIHQQGAFGSRLFLPPYMQPVEPNVPKQIVEGYTELGNYMARQMRAAGFKGITTDSTYDAWTPARAYSHYHAGVRILSETASCRLASPITVKFEQLRPGEGYDPRKETANFGPVWQGGEWHIRDITNHMTTGAMFLLKHAAQNRVHWLQRFYEIGKEAVRPRNDGEAFGFILPTPPSRGLSNTFNLRDLLRRSGVEVTETDKGWLVRNDQPYGGFAKALLETQHYPNLRDPSGHPIAPYDVTAQTLPLLMGITATPVSVPFNYILRPYYWGGTLSGLCRSASERLAIYKSSLPAIDEGWTRWLLETKTSSTCMRPVSLKDAEARGGDLRANYDAIVIPDQPRSAILNGHRAGTMPPEYTGGLGTEGVKALREFVEQGGTLVFLNRASDFAIEQFKLPLRDVVDGLIRTDFYVPDSILRIELDTANPIAKGMPRESIAWVEGSPVFEVVDDEFIWESGPNRRVYSSPPANVHVIAWYPKDKDPLLSGWLLGGERIKGKAALVEVIMGKGRIILFGFRPQYRGQSLATYPLFFNAITSKGH
jgi:hypothetical protein